MAMLCAEFLKRRGFSSLTIPAANRFAAAVVVAGGFVFLAVANSMAADASAVMAAMNVINADDAQQFINVLAGDAFEGRETGTRGGRAAGAYLGTQFQQFKLKGGAADKGYYQPFGDNSRNILGWIEGSDPDLKSQYVFVTAHYDHVGYGNRRTSLGGIGQIHNGADDNASGDAGVLETIRAFEELPQPPKRSVMFVLWDGEEEGLLGSKYWIGHPTVPLTDVAACVNVDMIGRLRNNHVIVYGDRSSYGWRQLLSRDNDSTELGLDFDWTLKADSDHHPFITAGIPTIMLHTGLHEDYHRPSDKPEKINSPGLQTVARLMFRTALELADEDSRPKFRSAVYNESPATETTVEHLEPALSPRLGLTWDEGKAKDGVVEVATVTGGSAGAKAGFKAGDKIVEYAGRPVSDAQAFREMVMATRGVVTAKVQRSGSDAPLELKVQPLGQPISMGITWRSDEAEPGSVFLVRVAPGSPADRRD